MLTLFLNTSIASQYIWLQIVAREPSQWTYMGQCGSQEQLQNEEAERAAVAKRQQRAAEAQGQRKQAAEAEDALRKQAEEAYRQAEDAETILLKFNGPDGSFNLEVRLNGTVLELKEKVLAELGIPKEFVYLLEFEFSGYELEPDEKTVREFDELCPVRCC